MKIKISPTYYSTLLFKTSLKNTYIMRFRLVTAILFTFFAIGSVFTHSTVSATPKAGSSSFFSKKDDDAKVTQDTAKAGKNKYEELKGKNTNIQSGLFNILQKDKDYYYEIPAGLLNRDLLVVNKIQQVPQPLNEAGINKGINYENILIRFELDKKNEKLMIRMVHPKPYAPEGDAIGNSVNDNFISSIIEGLKIEATSNDSTSYIVKINDLYNGTETSLNSLFASLNFGSSALSKLSRIIGTKAFDNNIVVTSELTTKVTELTGSIYITIVVNSSIVALPEEPMSGRFENNRVGYFTTPQLYFSDKQQALESHDLITRWKLEPKSEDIEKYMAGELVEPEKPIVFYIDSSTPYQWRKYMKQGIEDWQVAFERAGFKNAIIAKEVEGNDTIDMDNIDYSGISYIASPKVNAMGPSIYDPRSGEIIGADIIWWHNVMTMLQKWNVIQTGTVNPEARAVVLPDELMGDAMRFVACHEVGHSLGLRHNMIASAAFPTDSLRSKTFTDKMNSTSSSIMDYARYNYVTQPGDGVTALSPHIGPYDIFAIEYGYRWYGIDNPHQENDILFDLLTKHQGPLYKYSEAQDPRDAIDPRAQSEDLGDDPVKSSLYGIANLKLVVPEIINWTKTGKKGQNYEEAGRLYYAIINQWNNYLYHPLANIGGMYIENTVVGDQQVTYKFVEKEKQQESLQFLLDEILTNPEWLFSTDLNNYVFPLQNSPHGYLGNSPSLILKNAQSYIYWDLLNNKRLMRMLENENLNGKNAFTVVELMDKLHRHIFKATEKGLAPDAFERSIQKSFVDALILAVSSDATNKSAKKMMDENHFLFDSSEDSCPYHAHDVQKNLAKAPNFYGSQADRISDAVSVKRGELFRIKELLQRRSATQDIASQYHYKDIILRINTALEIK